MLVDRFLTAILAWALPLLTAHAQAVTMVAPDFWCPYSCTANHPREGFVVDILAAILRNEGVPFRYVNENYPRALQNVLHNVHQVVGPTYPDEVPALRLAPTPVTYNRMCFFTLPGSPWKFTDTGSLGDIRLGIIEGYKYGKALDEYIALNRMNQDRIDLNTGDDLTPRMVRKMQAHRFDAFIEDRFLVRYLSRQTRGGLTLREAGCLAPIAGYLAFSPANPDTPRLIELYESGMRTLLKSGQLKGLLDRYDLPADDWRQAPAKKP